MICLSSNEYEHGNRMTSGGSRPFLLNSILLVITVTQVGMSSGHVGMLHMRTKYFSVKPSSSQHRQQLAAAARAAATSARVSDVAMAKADDPTS
mmetsp:Transcript_11383/g.34216  ORF Transcript_11383/g.34216 Transcript_11383/m.34216 type:complete len:94 (+) Transcript_11383:1939-2220(+)